MKGGLPRQRRDRPAQGYTQTLADRQALDMQERLRAADDVAQPSGVECIDVTERMSFCVGSAVKYLWRADLKGDPLTDLRKARWYVEREIARRERER